MKYQYYLDLLDLKDDDNLNEEIIKKQYKKFALKCHPDKGGCAEDFHEIQEAYENLLEYIKIKKEVYNEENLFGSILNNLFKSFSNDSQKEIIKNNMINKIENISFNFISLLEKEHIYQIYKILSINKNLWNIDNNILEKMKNILTERMKKEKIIILNPSLSDLYENNIYKLNYENQTFFVPLWHSEVYFDLNEEELIIKILPEFNDNMWVDDKNNIHFYYMLPITNDILNDEFITIEHYKKELFIPREQLKLKKYQTYTFEKEGISKINENNLYDIDDKSNLIIHIHINEK